MKCVRWTINRKVCPHPASCTMGSWSFPGVKSVRGVTLTTHHLLVPWSRKSRAIPLFPLWAVRPVQSLSACTGVNFTFTCPHHSCPEGLYRHKSNMVSETLHVLYWVYFVHACINTVRCLEMPAEGVTWYFWGSRCGNGRHRTLLARSILNPYPANVENRVSS